LEDGGEGLDDGPNRALDVYLVDIGQRGDFGYCRPDPIPRHVESRQAQNGRAGDPAYCVLDDDFAERQFRGSVHGRPALRVTVAHEFFHALQMGYVPVRELEGDSWLFEGSAVWMEDEVFDSLNANRALLQDSPIPAPELPLDSFPDAFDGEEVEFGAWLFFRFLSEFYGDRDVVREAWRHVATRRGRIRDAGTAVDRALRGRRPGERCLTRCSAPSFADVWAEFGVWNALYTTAYTEGAGLFRAIGMTGPPRDAQYQLSMSHPSTDWRRLSLDHLSTGIVGVEFEAGTPASARLRVEVDLPGDSSAASVVDFPDRDPSLQAPSDARAHAIELTDAGNGILEVSRDGRQGALLLLHNGSRDLDLLPFHYRITLVP
jgi:hypothetical protein